MPDPDVPNEAAPGGDSAGVYLDMSVEAFNARSPTARAPAAEDTAERSTPPRSPDPPDDA